MRIWKSFRIFNLNPRFFKQDLLFNLSKISLLFTFLLVAFIACNGNLTPFVTYANIPTNPNFPSTSVTGIRGITNSTNVYMTGGYVTDASHALLYQGPLFGGGFWTAINPSSTLAPGQTISSSNLYGPDNSTTPGNVDLVGTYKVSGNNTTFGFYYSGPPDGSGSTWLNLNPSSLVTMGDILIGTVPHSIMNGIAVGNFDTQLDAGRVFIYNVANSTYYELTKSGATSISAYGIWWNGGTSYTITGGYLDPINNGEVGYLVDWNSSTQVASNWRAYTFQNDPLNITHFEGITTDNQGGYNLAGGWSNLISSDSGAAFANVGRNSNNSFGAATWFDISFPGANSTTGNTVYQNNVLGVYLLAGSTTTNPYIATINNFFQ